jgi:RNA polymerase sigma-70 factor, ECF subfamily
MDQPQPPTNDRSQEFVRLLTEHDRDVLLYILSLVPNWADAEEIHQETNIKLWQEFAKFRPQSGFVAWARTIARYEVLTFRERKQRHWQHMSQRFLSLVTAEVEAAADQGKARQAALVECVEELGSFHREVVRLHYTVRCKIKDIAHKLGRTPDAVYKAIQRTRLELRQCVERKLGEGESP